MESATDSPEKCTAASYPTGSVYQLGSAHSGVLNALVGDGSVRGIPKTVEPYLLWQLTYVNDAAAVTLP